MPSAEEARNIAAFTRFHDAVNAHDAETLARTIDDFVLPDAEIRTPLPIDAAGPEKLKQVWSLLFAVYPDLHLAVDDMIAAGDKIVVRNTVTGTHLGEFMGSAPTGRSVTYNEIFIFRFIDGRVAETWGVVDVLAQMRQIGLLER
jgi:predicted ester cyclase